MALETLKDFTEIDGVKIMSNDDRPLDYHGNVHWGKLDEMRKEFPVCVDHEANMISFKIQDGPIKEKGLNGCQLTSLISIAKHMIKELSNEFPCRENSMTITKLDEALMWQDQRTKNREDRNVEGTSQA